jgi:hypothetical protein
VTDEGETSVPPEWRDLFESVQIPPEMVMAKFARNELPALIQAATVPRPGKKTTSPRAAQELCFAAVYCLERGIPMPAPLREYIINGLRAGIEGRSVDAALKLKRGKGQSKDEDPLYVNARERHIAVRIFQLKRRDGLSEPEAKERACEEFELDTRRIEQIWERYRPPDDADARWDAWLKRFFELQKQVLEAADGEHAQAWRSLEDHLRSIGWA